MRRERQTQLIEKKRRQERIQKSHDKRYSKKDAENMELLLIDAKMILGCDF